MSHQGIHYTLLDATLGEKYRLFHIVHIVRRLTRPDECKLRCMHSTYVFSFPAMIHPKHPSRKKVRTSSRIKLFSRFHTHVYFPTDYTKSVLDTQKTLIMEPMQLTPSMLAEIDHISERMAYISENVFSPKMSAIVLRKAACCQNSCTCSEVKELNLHKESLENILSNTDVQE